MRSGCAARPAARAAGRLYGIGVAAIVEPSVSNMGYISPVLPPEGAAPVNSQEQLMEYVSRQARAPGA